MKWSKPRATISIYKFFSAKQFEHSIVGSKNTIRFWKRARSITVWFSQTVVHKIDKTTLYFMNYRHISSHFGRLNFQFFPGETQPPTFDMEIIFHSHSNNTHFQEKGCAPSLILKVRVFSEVAYYIQTSLFFYPWPLKRFVREPEQVSSL